MADPAARAPVRHALPPALLLAAVLLASCSSNDSTPTNPIVTNPNPAPQTMFHVLGDPRVAVRFGALLTEASDSSDVTGPITVTMTDSSGHRVFLPDVRINGVAMHEETDPTGLPSRYVLDAGEIPGLALTDTLSFEAVDGGDVTTPFTYRIYPSQLTLPADSTAISPAGDIVIPWTGVVERVLVTLTDLTGKRLRINLQVENFSGLSKLTIPGRDLAGLYPGDIQVGTDVLDAELVLGAGLRQQQVQVETRQNRMWRLAPASAKAAPPALAAR